MEALRAKGYLKPGGKLVVNDFEIPPMPVLMGKETYPAGILAELSAKADTLVVRAGEVAQAVGNGRTMNIVLLGALVKAMDITGVDWREMLCRNVKPGFEDINWSAFQAGYAL